MNIKFVKLEVYKNIRKLICPFDKVILNVPKRGCLLDVGSGYGIFCSILTEERPNLIIEGVELDKERVEIAYNKFKSSKLCFIQGDVTTINFGKKYDIVTCIDIFHHIPSEHHDPILKNIYKCLKSDGILIIKDMDNRPVYKYLWNYLHDCLMTKSLCMYYVPKIKMINMIEKIGFSIERNEDIGNILYAHYYITCIKNKGNINE
jgi:2-polyprenyl-3-methyl-5-hydroxy-6-metoxy-1,4-benzoquinol methylase